MRKIVGFILLTGALMLPGIAKAAGQVGVYVAPKFVYGLTQMDSVKVRAWGGDNAPGGSTDRIGSKTDHAFGGSLAVGYDFSKQFSVPIRAELEYAALSKAEAKRSFIDEGGDWSKHKQTFAVQTLFLNAYWDIKTGTPVTPYLGAGAGLGFINTKFRFSGYDPEDPEEDPWSGGTGSKTVTNFAWNVGAGVGFDLNERWTVDLGYRFVGLGSVKTKTGREDDVTFNSKASNLYQHQFAVGVRYTF